jgi:hypothetical protein
MGNWNINVQGHGCHHNRTNPTDANLLAAKFVQELKAAGHTIESATFTSGSKEELNLPPVEMQGRGLVVPPAN